MESKSAAFQRIRLYIKAIAAGEKASLPQDLTEAETYVAIGITLGITKTIVDPNFRPHRIKQFKLILDILEELEDSEYKELFTSLVNKWINKLESLPPVKK